MLRKYIGDRHFYRRVLAVALPIIVQNAITNFVWMLDNVMVGQVGTLSMSGVSIVNQLLFVFNLCVFGATSGAGIFTAQFHGNQDQEGIRHTFRFKWMICLLLVVLGWGLFLTCGDELILLYLQGEGDVTDAQQVLHFGKEYLQIMLIGLLPFAICNAYAGTLRETGQTMVPMVGGIVAVLVNLGLNYVFIFGKLGAPAMGASGAAVATVISRFVELAVVAGWTHANQRKNPFIQGAYRSLYIPGTLLKQIAIKGMPLLANEFLWSSGMAVLNQCYSTCGLDVVPAMNISSTLYNVASVGFLAMGNSVGIIMGQMMGAGLQEETVRDTNRKLLTVSVGTGLLMGGLMATLSGVFPLLYETGDAVRHLATGLMLISAGMMPFNAYTNATYFTLRSGGKTLVTFLFDSCFVWVICVPLAYGLSRFTALPILALYAICQATDLIKCTIGAVMLKKGSWIQNLAR